VTKTNHDTFAELLEVAEADDGVVGLFLVGSRGKGFADEHSDYDVRIILNDDTADAHKANYTSKTPAMDVSIWTFSDFAEYARWQSDTHWDRYAFSHVQALVDKTGGAVQRLIDEKGSVPREHAHAFINASLDGYINCFYRSAKAHWRHDAVGVRMAAAASIPCLLDALFAWHGRTTPFPDYLSRELAVRPLGQFSWSADKLLAALLTILGDGDLTTQQKLARAVEVEFRKGGYGKMFDAWDGRDQWAMNLQQNLAPEQ
jgi:Nucleotidyltransferase domain